MNITGTVTMERLENRIIRVTISDFPNKSILCTKDEMNLNFKTDTNTISFYSDGYFYENIPMGNVTILGVVIADETTFNTQVGLLFKDAVEDDVQDLINSLDVMTIATVADFAPLQPKAAIKVIIVRDTVRGGEFRRYTGAYADDQGIVFTDALGGKWFRRIKDNCINVQWFGMTLQLFDDAPPPSNMSPIWDKVYSAALDPEVISYPNIYFPSYAGNGNPDEYGYYFRSAPIELTYPTNIFSDGRKATILFAENLYTGLIIEQNGSGSTVKNLKITQYRDQPFFVNIDNWIASYAGAFVYGKSYFENVDVQLVNGDGFYIFGASGEGDSRYSQFVNCTAKFNAKCGFNIIGNQAYGISFVNCQAITNGSVGFDCQISKGGNSFISCVADGNSAPNTVNLQRSIVTDGVNYYQCILDLVTGIPLSNTQAWVRLDNNFAGTSYIRSYIPTGVYYRGGGFDIDSTNDPRQTITNQQMQKSVLIGCIATKDQPLSYTSAKTIVIGGLFENNSNGEELYYSPRFFTNYGQDQLDNAAIKEMEFTTANTDQIIIARDFYLNRAVCYEIDIVAVAPGFDMWITKRRITITGKKGTNATAVKQSITVGTEQKDAGINTATIGTITNDTTIGIYNCAIYVTGVAGTTVHWKVHVRKIFTSVNF